MRRSTRADCGHPKHRMLQCYRYRNGVKYKNGVLCLDCHNATRQAKRAEQKELEKEAEAECRT